MSDLAPTSSTAHEPTQPNGAAKIDKYFRAMSKHDASDLHMKADTPPKFRLNGTIRNIDGTLLTNEQIESMVFEITGEENNADYRDHGSVDFAYQLSGADRPSPAVGVILGWCCV